MATLSVFDHVSVDGYFAGPRGEIDWFKAIREDDEYSAYTKRQSQSGGTLVFGRTTYELMKSYWPTPAARSSDPDMARVVTESPKIVFSRTLPDVKDEPNWKNVTVLRDIDDADVRRRKRESRAGLTILGSGSIVRQLAKRRLIDEYRLVLVPIVLGGGKALFEGLQPMNLELVDAKHFENGLVLLTYRSAESRPARR